MQIEVCLNLPSITSDLTTLGSTLPSLYAEWIMLSNLPSSTPTFSRIHRADCGSQLTATIIHLVEPIERLKYVLKTVCQTNEDRRVAIPDCCDEFVGQLISILLPSPRHCHGGKGMSIEDKTETKDGGARLTMKCHTLYTTSVVFSRGAGTAWHGPATCRPQRSEVEGFGLLKPGYTKPEYT